MRRRPSPATTSMRERHLAARARRPSIPLLSPAPATPSRVSPITAPLITSLSKLSTPAGRQRRALRWTPHPARPPARAPPPPPPPPYPAPPPRRPHLTRRPRPW